MHPVFSSASNFGQLIGAGHIHEALMTGFDAIDGQDASFQPVDDHGARRRLGFGPQFLISLVKRRVEDATTAGTARRGGDV